MFFWKCGPITKFSFVQTLLQAPHKVFPLQSPFIYIMEQDNKKPQSRKPTQSILGKRKRIRKSGPENKTPVNSPNMQVVQAVQVADTEGPTQSFNNGSYYDSLAPLYIVTTWNGLDRSYMDHEWTGPDKCSTQHHDYFTTLPNVHQWIRDFLAAHKVDSKDVESAIEEAEDGVGSWWLWQNGKKASAFQGLWFSQTRLDHKFRPQSWYRCD